MVRIVLAVLGGWVVSVVVVVVLQLGTAALLPGLDGEVEKLPAGVTALFALVDLFAAFLGGFVAASLRSANRWRAVQALAVFLFLFGLVTALLSTDHPSPLLQWLMPFSGALGVFLGGWLRLRGRQPGRTETSTPSEAGQGDQEA